jgi:outer membrane lipase/esterase
MVKRELAAGVVGATLAVVSAEAAAQQFTNMIVFGDSLSDSGRLFAITGGTQPPSPPYFAGRFSNGPVWVELLPGRLGGFTFSPATNFAVGGAESGTGGPLGVTQQLALSGAAPVNPGTLGVVWAGANDYLNRLATVGPTVLVPQVIGNIVTAAGTVAARGAGAVLVANLPDLGSTPGGAAQGPATAFNLRAVTNIHNSGLHGALMGLEASRNTRIIVLDTYGLFADVLANPSLYGITNTSIPCITPAGATGACASAAAASGALFFDPIHPSATAHATIAAFAAATIDQDYNGARFAAISSFLGPQVLETLHGGTRERLDVLRATNTVERSTLPTALYGAVRRATGDRDGAAGVVGFDYEMMAYTIGVDGVLGDSFVVGGAASYVTNESYAEEDFGEIDTTAYGFSAYLGYRAGRAWMDLSGAASWEEYDIARNTGFAPRPLASGEANGNGFLVAFDAGYDLFDDELSMFGPVAGVRYINSDVDAYREDGAAMLGLNIGEQTNTGVIGSIGLHATAPIGNLPTVMPRARIAYENEMTNFKHRVGVSNGVGQTRTTAGGTGSDDWFVVAAGLSVQAGPNFALSADYSTSLGRGDGKDHAFMGRISLAY